MKTLQESDYHNKLLRKVIEICDKAYDTEKEKDILLDIYNNNEERYDGLAEFIVTEICECCEETNDPAQILCIARRAMETAQDQLTRVFNALLYARPEHLAE